MINNQNMMMNSPNISNMNMGEEKKEKKNDQEIIYIIFETNTGNKTININKNATLKEALKMYCQKMEISENEIGRRIDFISNNERLSYLDENITLGEKRFNDCSRINVVDISNLIGS